jgi:hypothetical protein
LNRTYCPHCYRLLQHPSSPAEISQACAFCGEAFEGPQSQLTWQKVVETPSRPIANYPPRPREPLQSFPLLRHIPYGWFTFSRLTSHPKAIFWALIVLFFIFTGRGALGVVESLQNTHAAIASSFSIQPGGDVNVGQQVTFVGHGFTPDGAIGFFLDATTPIVDVGGHTSTNADSNGDMKDIVVVRADWGGGHHVITAEDAHTHLSLTASISIIGDSGPLPPAHLHLSLTSLDLGPGDQATNTMQKVTLSNIGAGQISWHVTSSAPWLVFSPTSGVLTNDVPAVVMVAVDRANLVPDTYNADIVFSSNVGDSKLPVSMQVVSLQAVHEAVLQLTPAVLAFTGVDNASQPDPQMITVSNPGGAPLRWQATPSTSWLTLSTDQGTVNASGSGEIKATINNRSLLPGTYYATITFKGTGSEAVLHTPQQVFVSVTITAGCGLLIVPGELDFSSSYQQTVPAAKILTVSQTQGCSAPVSWSARSNNTWLMISQESGSTPSSPLISVDTTGMEPGSSKEGSITFTYAHGTQVISVDVTRGTEFDPGLSVDKSALSYSATADSGDATSQAVTITNTGASVLTWQVAASSFSNASWLSSDKTSGQLGAHQSTVLNVTANALATLVAGQYSGQLTITGTDAAGDIVPGSPQNIPVNFLLNTACSLQISQDVLNFYGISSASTSLDQNIGMTAGSTCNHILDWNVSTAVNDGGSWLQAVSTSGVLAPHKSTTALVSVKLAGLAPGSYQGTVTITAKDSGNNNQLVSSKIIPVSLTVQPPCTLQTASTSSLTFPSVLTASTSSQTFTVGVVGTCSSSITVNATSMFGTASWFTVLPASAVVASGHSATFTVTADTANLSAGNHYTDAISLSAFDAGMTIVGSSQTIAVNINIPGVPKLSADAMSQNTNIQTGIISQTILISNTGNAPLDWTALDDGTDPGFSLSQTSGTLLPGGSSTTIIVNFDSSNSVHADLYAATVLIQATDSTTGAAIGSIPVAVTFTVSPTPTPEVPSIPVIATATSSFIDPNSQNLITPTAGVIVVSSPAETASP